MSASPEAHYRDRQTALLAQQSRLSSSRGRMLIFTLGCVAAIVLIAIAAPRSSLQPRAIAVLGLSAAIGFAAYIGTNARGHRLARLIDHVDAAIGRTTGTAVQSGHTGEAFRVAGHLYDRDLDILGQDSLFGLLATVRTEVGQQRLAQSLLEAPHWQETLRRQEAIQELAPLTDLRERIALLGAAGVHQVGATLFDDWLDEPTPRFSPAVRICLVVTVAMLLLLVAAGIAHFASWDALAPNIAAVLALQGAVALLVRGRVLPVLERTVRLRQPLAILRSGLTLMRQQSFTAGKLRDLQVQATTPVDSTEHLDKLNVLFTLIDQRPKEWYYLLALLLCVGTQTVISLNRWKASYGADLRRWLDAWSEFEALNALATYAFEHPENVYPEILAPSLGQGSTPTFAATALRHPLLPRATAVANDIRLDSNSRFYVISGSNMAGKSTLLRTIGVNAVLAFAGAPIPAGSARISPLHLCASLALTDSLAEGKSKFFAEADRIHAILSVAAEGPVLFLIDEIFSGTNSLDRLAASDAILRALVGRGAIGALSTHDLALTAIADDPALHGLNLHMASPSNEDPLAFDYRLRSGINTASSAHAILRLLDIQS
jgi:hypothetical protein